LANAAIALLRLVRTMLAHAPLVLNAEPLRPTITASAAELAIIVTKGS